MNKKFVSLLATVAMLLNLSIFSWGGSMPLLTETASAFPYETVSGEEITIYETDFEQGRHVEFESPSTAELTAIGGWTSKNDESTASYTIREWDGSNDNNGGTDTGNRVLFVAKTGTSTNSTKWAQYIIPSWAKHSTGTYTYYFDFYHGSRVSDFWVGLADSIDRDDPNEHECNMVSSSTFNCRTNYTWYRCKIEINLDTHVSNWYSYAMDGTLIYHGSWQGNDSSGSNYSAALAGITNAPYINFEAGLASTSSNAPSGAWNFRLAAVDNLKITYQKSGVSVHAVTGNIYSNDFSTPVATNGTNSYYKTYGGWEIYYGRSGVAQGKDGTNGFAPFAAPFKESVNASDGAAYYLPDDKLYCTGVYNVNFDMRIGADCTNPSIYYHFSNDSLSGNGGATVNRSGTKGVAQLATITDPFPKEEWVNVDMTIDLDNRTWTWYLKKADGTIWKAWDGTWNGEKLGAVEFYNDKKGTAVAAASNTDVTCNYGYVIDNFAINHYAGSMIYSEDFEHGSIHEYVSSQNEAGGWDYSGSAGGIVSTGYDSAHGFAFNHADGQTVTAGDSSSDYYIPKVHVHNTGVYSLTFNLYVGTYEDNISVYLNDKDTWQSSSIVMAFSKNTDGEGNKHLDKGKWYKMKVNINLDTGSVQSNAYDPATGKSVANNGETYNRDVLRHIAFRSQASANGTVPSGGGPIMDNLIIHWFGTGSDQREMGESFDFGHLRSVKDYNASSTYGQSTWDLYDRSGYALNHFVDGGVHGSAMAFAPVFRPGKAREASADETSEYWVDGSLIAPMGQWRIGFWYKAGADLDSTETLEFNDANSYTKGTQEVIYTLTNSAIEKGKWYHLDAVLDFDLLRKNVRITDEKGNVVDEVNGTIGKEKLTYFSWHSNGGTAKTLTADDCLLIDDIGMIYNGASVNDTRVNEVQGITFDDTNNKLSYQAKVFNELFINDSDNIKGNKAILAAYDENDDLVYVDYDSYTYPGGCPTNDYWTTHHRNISYDDINGGNVDGLTFRMFLWDWNTDTTTTTGNPLSKVVEVTK